MLPYSLKGVLTFSLSFDNIYITLRLMEPIFILIYSWLAFDKVLTPEASFICLLKFQPSREATEDDIQKAVMAQTEGPTWHVHPEDKVNTHFRKQISVEELQPPQTCISPL